MSNTLTTVFEEIFGQVEERLKQYAPSMMIRGTIAQSGLNGAKTYQFANDPDDLARASQPFSDVAFNDIDAAEVVLDVREKDFEYSFRIDRRDSSVLQRTPEFISGKAVDAIKQLTRLADGQFFGEVFDEANTTFDDGDIGGTDGNGLALTPDNALQVVSEASAKLDNVAGPVGSEKALVLTPVQVAKLIQSNANLGFRVADDVLTETRNNFLGEYAGTKVFKSQFLTHTTVLSYLNGTDFADTTTLVINGVTITAKATIDGASQFDQGTDADTSATNLVALLNNKASTVSGEYQAIGTFNSTNVASLNGISATVDTTNDEITIVSKLGAPTIVSTLTSVTVATAVIHNYLGGMGSNNAPELAMTEGGIFKEVRDEPKQPTTNFMSFLQFGTATPFFVKSKILDLQILAS